MYIDVFKNYYLSYNARNMPCAMIPLTTVSPYKLLTLSQSELRTAVGQDSWRITNVTFHDTRTADIWNLWLWNNKHMYWDVCCSVQEKCSSSK